IQPGMVFALETQHGKVHDFGVRIEEMLIVHEDRTELISTFPVGEITVAGVRPRQRQQCLPGGTTRVPPADGRPGGAIGGGLPGGAIAPGLPRWPNRFRPAHPASMISSDL
ncbi:MAG TPA: hypothetical protein VE343_04080, partial [Streptosporangiaceae bacterium]|nr:hypothetical protein [Streptosporangiaceae bacterium]